jgi:hypothetical protein
MTSRRDTQAARDRRKLSSFKGIGSAGLERAASVMS